MPLRPAHDRDLAALSRAWTQPSAPLEPGAGAGASSEGTDGATRALLVLLAAGGLTALLLGVL